MPAQQARSTGATRRLRTMAVWWNGPGFMAGEANRERVGLLPSHETPDRVAEVIFFRVKNVLDPVMSGMSDY